MGGKCINSALMLCTSLLLLMLLLRLHARVNHVGATTVI
jgi:hypothetical protein